MLKELRHALAQASGTGPLADAGPSAPAITVVLPAYRSARQIAGVLGGIPDCVRHVLVVDDASPDDLQEVLAGVSDPRLEVLRHAENRGVGAAMKTGFNGFGQAIAVTAADEPMASLYRGDRQDPRKSDNVVRLR